MKQLMILIIAAITVIGTQTTVAQDNTNLTKEQKKAEKKKLKEEAKAQETAEWEELKTLFVKKDIVFMGNVINGTTVDPKINFIKIVGDNAIIQFANGFGGGANVIGGITLDGIVDTYKLSAAKPGKEISLTMTIRTRPGQGVGGGPVNVMLSAFSYNSARISIGTGGFMDGEISSNEDARIFEGNRPN